MLALSFLLSPISPPLTHMIAKLTVMHVFMAMLKCGPSIYLMMLLPSVVYSYTRIASLLSSFRFYVILPVYEKIHSDSSLSYKTSTGKKKQQREKASFRIS